MWADQNGNSIEAEYVADAGGKVTIRTTDGRRLDLPIDLLSEADQAYVYNQNPPSLDIEVKKNLSRRETGTDYDNRAEEVKCEVSIRKTSMRPYIGELTAYLYVIGESVTRSQFEMLDTAYSTFSVEKGGEEHGFSGNSIVLEYDDNDMAQYGTKYEGYLVFIRDSEGTIMAAKASPSKFEERIGDICRMATGDKFYDDFKPSQDSRRTGVPMPGADGTMLASAKNTSGKGGAVSTAKKSKRFKKCDGNSDGSILIDEWLAFRESQMGDRYTEEGAVRLFNNVDKDGNGRITPDEF